MGSLVNKRILLGLSGGIAAYKSAEVVRRARAAGAEVRVVMTKSATRFITPLTMQALSGQPVHTELLDPQAEAAMGHIELARWADVVLIAPASANVIAKLAHGLADDLLSTLCLATTAPIVLAPAMNHRMWEKAATQDNCRVLRQRGVHILGPASGDQACGEMGPGRMLEAEELVEAVAALFENQALAGLSVLITAGPTREALDPVRFISNRSSGKMGYALAEAAAEAGAKVTLVSGPVALVVPPRVECVPVESAEDMRQAVMSRLAGCDIVIAAAAVADYRPQTTATQKIKKAEAAWQVALERTQDILAEIDQAPKRPYTVGFAAETERLEEHAQAKLQAKGLDMIAANWVGREGVGFESDDNALLVLWPGGRQELPRASKAQLARSLIKIIAEHYHAKS